MKRFLFVLVCTVLAASLVQAQEVRIGAHIGTSMDGTLDIETPLGNGDADLEDGLAYGAQLTHRANEAMSFEIAATRFSTEIETANVSGLAAIPVGLLLGTEIDIMSIAATLRLGGSPAEGVYIYGGGGGSYNMFDVDSEVFGDPDDEFGYHFCAGLELPIDQTAQFFAEYRMTYITLEDDDIPDVDLDFEFGLVRAGINFLL